MRFGSWPSLGGNGSQLDLFSSTQPPENATTVKGVDDDPLVQKALKISGRLAAKEEVPVRNNELTGEQREVEKRNQFDIFRNSHNWY
ncbi:MAG: hypothetical protein QE263_07040 [Vampirovibrionales bacterium]|nr:hypothetical protein [Vampirovibrionales bacterium]